MAKKATSKSDRELTVPGRYYRYAGIDEYEYVNGVGVGVTLYMQGCVHHCKGCHNPETWDFEGGKDMDMIVMAQLFETLDDPNVNRLTLSGGDPFNNVDFANDIALLFKINHPDKALWIFTGYTYEELVAEPKARCLLEKCDVLVDGEYIEELRDLSLAFRGSSNQRIIDVKKSLETSRIIEWRNEDE